MATPMVRRLVYGLLAIAVVVAGGAIGYWLIGRGQWRFYDCVYMTVITITTVGYGEILPNLAATDHARSFTVVLLVFGTGTIVFFASTVTAFIIEGDLRNVLFANKLKKRIKKMKDHVVVCGAGSTGRNVIAELLAAGLPVIAIDRVEGELKELASKHSTSQFSYIIGDATEDEIINQANLASARGLVAALSSDKDNLYLTVSGRQTNPTMRIVARCAELSHVDKIKRSGADAVVSPNYIGGMRLVSELLRPAVVRFLDDMLRDRRAAFRIEEVTLGPRAASLGATLRDARVRERFGMTVLAMRGDSASEWAYNPEANEPIGPGSTLVVLGSLEQLTALRAAAS